MPSSGASDPAANGAARAGAAAGEPGSPPRANARFLLAHPAHVIALGFGAGLSPLAPGTAGTLLAWLAHAALSRCLDERAFGLLIAAAALVGWWACTLAARHLRAADPGVIVWDEVVAFWAVLWLVTPGSFGLQCAAFVLFRLLDAVKPGPIGWVDARFKRARAGGWTLGLGILLDDAVAALCTLLVLAVWRAIFGA